ncbi:MAG: hypothetical protein WAU33_20870 [Candidatus Binataceae bacterium]
MRRTIGMLLAGGLAVMFAAGCASTSGGGSSAGTTGEAAGSSGAGQQTASADSSRVARDFNLRVKCPGVHEEKIHGWTDQQIMAQESVAEEDIPACMAWVQEQPKGFVPPPPAGYVPKVGSAPAAGGAAGGSTPPPAPPASH